MERVFIDARNCSNKPKTKSALGHRLPPVAVCADYFMTSLSGSVCVWVDVFRHISRRKERFFLHSRPHLPWECSKEAVKQDFKLMLAFLRSQPLATSSAHTKERPGNNRPAADCERCAFVDGILIIRTLARCHKSWSSFSSLMRKQSSNRVRPRAHFRPANGSRARRRDALNWCNCQF